MLANDTFHFNYPGFVIDLVLLSDTFEENLGFGVLVLDRNKD